MSHVSLFHVSCFIKVVPHVARFTMLKGQGGLKAQGLLLLRGVPVDLGLVFL